MAAKVGVVRFPGTNCEFDTVEAINALGGQGEIRGTAMTRSAMSMR